MQWWNMPMLYSYHNCDKSDSNSFSHDASFNLDLRHNNRWYQLRDNEEPIVWHEPILDEYWDKVEGIINQRRQLGRVAKIRDIHIENVEITKERLAALVAIFRNRRANNSIETINFNNTNLCGEGIITLSKLVDFSSNLHQLIIAHNRIDNINSARCLSRSLRSHACINQLRLSHCDLGSSPEVLSVILQADVKTIYLNNNNINSLGAVKIAECLEGDPLIEHLFLGHNQLNDDDAQLISQALKRNTNLRRIDFLSNNFTSIGAKALLTCVFDSSSLNAISESNHTMVGMIIFLIGNNLHHWIDRLLCMDRMQKIICAMHDKDSLLQYLAYVPVEIMPEVLAFPRWNVPRHKHLHIVYSTMRWWNMPLLYSYHNHNCIKSDAKRKRDD
jgi:hypothetical protein